MSLGDSATRSQVNSFVSRDGNALWTSFVLERQSSLASLEAKFVRATLVPRFALNNFEARNHRQVFHFRESQPRAVATATHAASGGDAPPLRFSDVTLGGAWPAHARVGRFP